MLREVTEREDVEKRLKAINERGVPNYFGAQRFGIGGSNLLGALRWAQSGAPVRDRNKRSFWLSAARSALFNQIVSERLKTGRESSCCRRCATISGTRKLVCGNGR